MNIIAKLKNLRDLIAKGWMQGKYFDGATIDESTRFCIIGACAKVAGEKGANASGTSRLSIELQNALRDQTPKYNLVRYNDAPGRTQAEVLNLIDKAIDANKT